MPTPPLVSVIVPSYNVERFLPDAVASVRRQMWKELELIIVDDGSTDGTAELAARFAAEDPRVRVVRKPNGGLSSARNAGIAAARGELVCFLDADDMLLPEKINRQVAFLELFPGCDLVYSDYYVGDDILNPVFLKCKRPPAVPMREILAHCNWFGPMSPLVRSRLLAKVGGFDEELTSSEDWDYWIRASRCGVLAYLPGPVGVYRTHPGQMHKNFARMRTNQEKVIRKHYPPGSNEWRIARASMAWNDAKRAWVARSFGIMATKLVQVAWHARSRRTLKNVMDLAGYGG